MKQKFDPYAYVNNYYGKSFNPYQIVKVDVVLGHIANRRLDDQYVDVITTNGRRWKYHPNDVEVLLEVVGSMQFLTKESLQE